jgi:predicted nuclease of predicted toxin-antitoxin system
VRFLLDECLSHSYVADFVVRGYPDVIHPIHVGWRKARDDQLLARAIDDDRIIVSPNARDFRPLLTAATIHPGAIIVEQLPREPTLVQIFAAIAFIEQQPNPDLYMINRVIEVSRSAGVVAYELP